MTNPETEGGGGGSAKPRVPPPYRIVGLPQALQQSERTSMPSRQCHDGPMLIHLLLTAHPLRNRQRCLPHCLTKVPRSMHGMLRCLASISFSSYGFSTSKCTKRQQAPACTGQQTAATLTSVTIKPVTPAINCMPTIKLQCPSWECNLRPNWQPSTGGTK